MSRLNRDYISFEALGMAILQSRPWSEVKDLVPDEKYHLGPTRAVVLIDEIDKAPRDFPNDLLNEMQRMFFRIPEVQIEGARTIRRVDAHPELRPIVVLTSNSEKNLPPAFLRRCVFHHIRFPDRDKASRLRDIVSANLGQAAGALANDAIEFFYDTREKGALDKPPTSAELVQWIHVLQTRRWPGVQGHAGNLKIKTLAADEVDATLGVLAKTADDLVKVRDLLALHRQKT
jgi:MoxR-like ATPase